MLHLLPGISSLLIYPSGPFTCIFFQNLSQFFPERQTLLACLVFRMILLYYELWYDSKGSSLPSCVMLNTTEEQTSVDVCEETIRGEPRCDKHKYRHKKRERISWLSSGFQFLSGGLLSPIPGKLTQKTGKLTHFLS